MVEKKPIPSDYTLAFETIKKRIRAGQYDALRSVNRELVALYWDIGGMIAKRQKDQGWGKSVVKTLSQDLQKEFPWMSGFSTQKLWYIRQFYIAYAGHSKLQPLVGEISWSKHFIIMARCKDDMEREFYMRMTRKYGWTKNILAIRIQDQTCEKTVLGQTNFEKTLPEPIRNQAKLAVRDEYTFDFLELGEEHSEREFERAIIARIEHFLREMGGMFAFMGSQYRLEVDGDEFFIDLLLYHRTLKCLVAIELILLKVTLFGRKSPHAWKMGKPLWQQTLKMGWLVVQLSFLY